MQWLLESNFIKYFFWLLWFILIILFSYNFIIQKKFNLNYSLLKTNKLFFVKNLFLLFSFMILLLSFLWLEKTDENNLKTNGKNIIFTLDVSKSMNVSDFSNWYYSFTRLQIAKKIIWDYVSAHKENNYWLVVFAWEASSILPITEDSDLFLTFLDWVDYKNLTKQWSDFYQAIKFSNDRFLSDSKNNLIVMITDWWDDWDLNNIPINKLKNNNINYLIVWVWSDNWGKLIDGQDIFWRQDYKTYNWKDLILKLNKDNIDNISHNLDSKSVLIQNLNDFNKLWESISNIKNTFNISKQISSSISYIKEYSIISFIFFMIYLLLFYFEDRIYILINKKWTLK